MNTDRIKELRINNNLTQENIASYLNLSRSTYKDYELQIRIIPIKHLIKLASYYQVSLDYLLNLNSKPSYAHMSYEVNLKKAGIRLKEFRKDQHLTQEKLAQILNTTFSSIAFNEKGRNLIATPFLYTIAKLYHVSADYLIGLID